MNLRLFAGEVLSCPIRILLFRYHFHDSVSSPSLNWNRALLFSIGSRSFARRVEDVHKR